MKKNKLLLIFVRRVIGIKYKPFLFLCIVLDDVRKYRSGN